ncbi:MAG TPA: DsbA family protein [Xanthobacteraceae bacterium]|jgi:protein-disulfide isomerase|nr:DsbA family protein [Xanthobacteraceae bacterium]
MPVRVTRRELCAGTALLALAGAVLAIRPSGFGLVRPARADVTNEELMEPSPLGEQALGDPKAPVTLIEYAAVTCPHCSDFFINQFPEIKSKYIDTGKVHFIFREFPLNALDVAGFMLARCAGDDKFFPMVDTLFEKQREWVVQKPLEPLMAIAKQAGFTKESFEACLANQKVEDGVKWVRERATEKFGVSGTPTFFINGQKYSGNPTAADLGKQIDSYLKS